ncbi:endonuclease/exonuclease/phosphatase family protein [Actinomyces sp. 2119]|uniref:endonuclease/exonuclease/phosphatase family protein n=1 Tax=Actinomyces sp. 2119 TaxID=2321393 RepID=UPI0011C36F35|nr:endonuclease/exonuclease/phosphatase family protein [Actinomyces sp. 2119]
MSRYLHGLGWGVVALAAAVALVSLRPPLTMQPFVAQVVALRTFMTLGWGLLGLLLLATALLRRRLARSRAGRASSSSRAGLRTGALGLVLVLVALAHGGVLLGRGMSLGPLETSDTSSDTPSDKAAFTVMSLNTEREDAPVQAVAETARAVQADVVVLPETTAAYGEELAGLLRGAAGELTVYTAVSPPYGWNDEDGDGADDDSGAHHGIDPVRATTVLVSERLGGYRQTEGVAGAGRGMVVLEPVDGSGPVITGVHTYPPVPGLMGEWRSSLTTVAGLCQDPPEGLVMVGDFNATRDHALLRDLHACASAGEQAGVGGLATWPTHTGTRLLGATIDHVLVDASAWVGQSGEVLTLPQTDHRAVVVRLGKA